MHPTRPRFTASPLALTALAATLSTATTGMQQAAATSRSSSGLALRSGATLTPAKILSFSSDPAGIIRVVGDQDGAENRSDTNTEVTYALQGQVPFARNSARPSDAARSRITAIARQIEQGTATRVRTSGFTDNPGSSVHGDVLSKQRANAVRKVPAGELHCATVVFETRGFGKRHPVASNATEASRKTNRRVGGLLRMTGGRHRPAGGQPFVRERSERRHRTTERHPVPKATGYVRSCTSELLYEAGKLTGICATLR